MFRNLLVAIDGSPTARRALEEGAELAEALNSRLTLIAVAPGMPASAHRAGVNVRELEREIQADTEKLLREAVGSLPEDLPVTTVLKQGDAGERIVEQIRSGNHDLLVMGSRGRGRVASNLFGSVGAYVHYHARVAMLVMHPED